MASKPLLEFNMKTKLIACILSLSPFLSVFADTTLTANSGQQVTFTVTVAPTNVSQPLTYVWKRDALVVPGNNQPTLTIPVVTLGDAGVYTVTVSNAVGSTLSDRATLIVNPPLVPPTTATITGTIK